MMRTTGTLVMAVLSVFVGLGAEWTPSPVNAQEVQVDIPGCKGSPGQCTDEWLTRSAEGIACVAKVGTTACKDAWHARGWAITNAVKLFGDVPDDHIILDDHTIPDGDIGNAFQHCAWIGAIATWHTEEVAIKIGENHEEIVVTDHLHTMMDLKNNEIGAGIGEDAKTADPEDMWGYVMNTCADLARNGELYGPCGLGMYTPQHGDRPLTVDECPGPGTIG